MSLSLVGAFVVVVLSCWVDVFGRWSHVCLGLGKWLSWALALGSGESMNAQPGADNKHGCRYLQWSR